ncbi:DUF6694 family lipoprotein [uncultured Gilliamella sp.]|jgi:hypothetical protein|uniref:DUF6694 family lipoprotein n=1 Tax=uncultured Gilliamella sp. TaxID=1193505 RepID=UPI0025D91708|nr:DUF6694 family lipoprotein [uncultured Gilliamella sp.]
MKKLIIILISLTLLTACGEKKLDGSSPESLKNSMQEISKSLSAEDQKAFQQAFAKITIAATLKSQGDDDKLQEVLKKKLDGKTGAEVIEMANKNNLFD